MKDKYIFFYQTSENVPASFNDAVCWSINIACELLVVCLILSTLNDNHVAWSRTSLIPRDNVLQKQISQLRTIFHAYPPFLFSMQRQGRHVDPTIRFLSSLQSRCRSITFVRNREILLQMEIMNILYTNALLCCLFRIYFVIPTEFCSNRSIDCIYTTNRKSVRF